MKERSHRATDPGKTYGGHGLNLLRLMTAQGRATFTVQEIGRLANEIEIAPSYLGVLLHRLTRSGWIRRVKRGTYSLSAGLPGVAQAHAFAIGMSLVDPCAVSGWAALNHHGLTDQIPRVLTLTTPRKVLTPAMRGSSRATPSTWEVDGQLYEILTVVERHFFGYEEVWLGESRVRVFDKERALLDCFALPRRFGGLAEGLSILEEHLKDINVPRLVAHAQRYGTASVAKRVGWALEGFGARPATIRSLQTLPMQGVRPLDPTRPVRGRRNDRWGLLENLGKRVSS